jgi:tetratricopeptide (TPR) repeat protein
VRDPGIKKILIVCIAGLSIAVLLLGSLIALTLFSERAGTDAVLVRGDWYQSLREYDLHVSRSGGRNNEALWRILDRLEGEADGIEAQLSLLKRRRQLVTEDPRFLEPYTGAARRAAAAFPYSGSLAAVAAESLLFGASLGERRNSLVSYAALMSEASLSPLVLAIHVLLGDLSDNQRAAGLSALETLTAAAFSRIAAGIEEEAGFAADIILLRILAGDISGAAGRIASNLTAFNRNAQVHTSDPHDEGTGGIPSSFIRLAAEFYYDFGDPRRSAELFVRLGDEESLAMAASALALAGDRSGAGNLWSILASGGRTELNTAFRNIQARSLYNLAAAAQSREEESQKLEELFTLLPLTDSQNPEARLRTFASIRYTRLLETGRAQAVLESGGVQDYLSDLELLRRRSEAWPVDRTVAETWLLVNRHSEEEALYHRAAWYFNYQRQREETAILLEAAKLHGDFNGSWISFYEALSLMERGELDRAQSLLRAVSPAEWQVEANLGLSLEARRTPSAALEAYERAVGLLNVTETAYTGGLKTNASRLQVRIARCLNSLGKSADSRRALQYALDLNPNNLSARLALRRLDEGF